MAQGAYHNDCVFFGLWEAVVAAQASKDCGVSMKNFKYSENYDQFCYELSIIRPESYCIFAQHFPAHSMWSFCQKRSTAPKFCQGISSEVIKRAEHYLEDYGYPRSGPIAMAVDNIALHPAFWPYFDGKHNKWYILGTCGNPIEVHNINHLEEDLKSATNCKAKKLRLWTLQIPLPHVPPLILAIMPIATKTDADQLSSWDLMILSHFLPAGFQVLSLASDGTAVEQESRKLVMSKAEIITYQIPHPDGISSNIRVQVHWLYGQPVVVIQDIKHAQKTLWNNAFCDNGRHWNSP
jgi:hypothetical protein